MKPLLVRYIKETIPIITMDQKDIKKRSVLEFKEFIKVEAHKEIQAKKDFLAPGHHVIVGDPLYANHDPNMFTAAGIEIGKPAKAITEGELPAFDTFMNEHFIKDVENVLIKSTFEGLNNTGFFSKQEKALLESVLKGIDLTTLNESLLDSLKKGIDKVKDVAKDLKGQAIEKVESLIKSAKDFANWIADIFSKAFDKIIGFFKKKYEPAKKAAIEGIKSGKLKFDVSKDNVKNEIKSLGLTISYWIKDFPKMMVDAIKNIFSKKLIEESFKANEGDLILELSKFDSKFINSLLESEKMDMPELEQSGHFSFLNKVEHILHKVPPFSILHKVKILAEKGTEFLLNGLSKLTKEIGGPGAFDFILIPAAVSFLVDYNLHHISNHFMETIIEEMLKGEWTLRLIPGAKALYHTLGYIGLIIIAKEFLTELSTGKLEADTEE